MCDKKANINTADQPIDDWRVKRSCTLHKNM